MSLFAQVNVASAGSFDKFLCPLPLKAKEAMKTMKGKEAMKTVTAREEGKKAIKTMKKAKKTMKDKKAMKAMMAKATTKRRVLNKIVKDIMKTDGRNGKKKTKKMKEEEVKRQDARHLKFFREARAAETMAWDEKQQASIDAEKMVVHKLDKELAYRKKVEHTKDVWHNMPTKVQEQWDKKVKEGGPMARQRSSSSSSSCSSHG